MTSLLVPSAGTRVLAGAPDPSGANDGLIQMLDAAAKGARGWKRKVPASTNIGIPFNGGPFMCAAGGRFVCGGDRVYAFDAATGVPAWNVADTAGQPIQAVTAAPDGQVFAATQNDVYCVGTDGRVRWKISAPGGGTALANQIKYDFGNVYVPYVEGTVWAVDAASGKTRWKFSDARITDGNQLMWEVGEGMVFFASGNSITAVDASGI